MNGLRLAAVVVGTSLVFAVAGFAQTARAADAPCTCGLESASAMTDEVTADLGLGAPVPSPTPTTAPTAKPTTAPGAADPVPSAAPSLTTTPAAAPDPTILPLASATPAVSPKPISPTHSTFSSGAAPGSAPAPITRPVALGGPILGPAPGPTPTPKPAPGAYSYDLYSSSWVRYQDPDYTACVASSGEMMLNFIAAAKTGGPGFIWNATTSYATQETLLAFMRAHMSQVVSHPGSDSHGWKNALNYYGWGSLNAGVYIDKAYSSYLAAAKAAIVALAMYHKPVGIIGWAGGHAQLMNGYKVYGDDPSTGSMNFTVSGVYITDPLRSDGYRNAYVSSSTWQTGDSHIRFAWYTYTDDPGRDPVDRTIGNAEWFHHWVIVVPLK